jgi:antitoxin component HigA of HigAB toxin-antitoxin module
MAVKTRKIKDSYFELISEFPLRKLVGKEEYRHALGIFARFAGREKLDDGIIAYMDILADVIADYERRAGHAIDTSKVSAADVVRHLMEENGLTISRLAREIGIGQSNLSEILSGKREWSKKAIKGLSERFSLNPMLFLS